mgnify:CR=1 FL=1
MNRIFLVFLCLQVFSMNVTAKPFSLRLHKSTVYEENRENTQGNELNVSEGISSIKFKKEDKSVLPVVLSVSFLLMSLYGDNPDSPMYRTVGAAATFASFNWYFD